MLSFQLILLAGIDYDDTPLTATFSTGETSVIVTIPVVDDKVVNEEDEKFNVTLNVSSANGVRVKLGDVNTATGIIIDTSKESLTKDGIVYLIFCSKATNHFPPTQ